MFMHNGVIGDWSQIRRPVEAMIPDELYPARLGTTDSEAVFLAIMGAGGADDPVGATTRVLNVLTGLVNSGAQRDPLRFTSAMTDGKDLYAFRYAVNDNANSLYYRAAGDDVVIVSEPLDKDRSIWTAVPANHVLIARAGERVELAPMFAEKRQAAE
jgi:glutamine amidotransferase